MIVVKRAGTEQNFETNKLSQFISNMVNIMPKLYGVDVSKTVKSIKNGLTDRMSSDEILHYVTNHCASLGSHSHDYSILAGRISTILIYNYTTASFTEAMKRVSSILLPSFVEKVLAYDYDKHIIETNDFKYDILGISTLKRSYLLRDAKGIVERPQYMLMRVAVFLCDSPEEAIETYQAMSNGLYTHASPTLFHSGMKQHQLASCFLMTMKEDSIEGIYDSIKDTALISKSAGGIGISVSNIRAKGSPIAGTNGTSNGLVPMLRVLNNTARYCDQGGGKRKGSFAIFH
jgi:ribonucleoside-diphosphate reductase alpha chain